MADDVEMIPVEDAEPPKKTGASILNPRPVGPETAAGLKPGLKLPPKPGATVSVLRPGLKLPPKPGATVSALRPGLKLPPKPGAGLPAAGGALKPGLKLPPKPGAGLPTAGGALKPGLKLPTQSALKTGLKLPPKPVIRKPGATVAATPLPKPVAIDAQGVGKLPTVGVAAVSRSDAAPVAAPDPMKTLKSVTQKLKGITQEIPQQAILRKTGIISDGASEAQKESAKRRTARISLADAMGVAPVKDEVLPMKTIRIKRPIDISNPAKPQTEAAEPVAASDPDSAKTVLVSSVKSAQAAVVSAAKPVPEPVTATSNDAAAPATAASETEAAPTGGALTEAPTKIAETKAPAVTATQRKTLKIARPASGVARPTGKFGIKRPSVQTKPTAGASKATTPDQSAGGAAAADGVADIPDIPDIQSAPQPLPHATPAAEGAGWATTLAAIVQLAACGVVGALAWFLYENAQLATFCGGLGWGV